mgnify:CR=1 FL=1
MPVAVAITSRSENSAYLARAVASIQPPGSTRPIADFLAVGLPSSHVGDPPAWDVVSQSGISVSYWNGQTIRSAARFVERVAAEHGWAFWLADDEEIVIQPDADIRLDAIVAAVTAEMGRIPIAVPWIAPNGTVCRLGRLIPRGYRFPDWVRQSLQSVGNEDPSDMWPVAAGIGVRRGPVLHHGGAPRLNIGAGPRAFPGWISVDFDPTNKPDILWEADGPQPLPFPDGSVAAVYCSHMIDHLDWRAGRRFLKECARALAPGAPIRLVCCDARVFATKYLNGTLDDFTYFQPPEFAKARTAGSKFGILGCGAMSDRPWYAGHRQFFDGPALCEALEDAGLKDAVEQDENECHPAFDDVDDIFPDHSAYAEATAPGP